LAQIQEELAPMEGDNRLVPMIERGEAPVSVFATIAGEESHIVRSDLRSMHFLAARGDEHNAIEFFAGLAQGEAIAQTKLPGLAAAGGMDEDELARYEPLAGCQAYPAYFAWLALNGEIADVLLGVVANFAAWGDYCGRTAKAMREKYGLGDEACAFFDFFAEPIPDAVEQAIAAAQAGMDAGHHDEPAAHRYGRLFQSYELMFWNTIADEAC
jgi:hypothetical protein